MKKEIIKLINMSLENPRTIDEVKEFVFNIVYSNHFNSINYSGKHIGRIHLNFINYKLWIGRYGKLVFVSGIL